MSQSIALELRPCMSTMEILLTTDATEKDPYRRLKKIMAIQDRLNGEIRRLNDKLEGQNGATP